MNKKTSKRPSARAPKSSRDPVTDERDSAAEETLSEASAGSKNSTTRQVRQLPPERLQKVAASAGLGSRRALERNIEAGELSVNGKPAKLGATVQEGDRVSWHNNTWRVVAKGHEGSRVLIYFKPEGEVTTRHDPEGRKTVFQRLPKLQGSRWISIGRLDIGTSGLLLLTTDGELANGMMHPSGGVDREYMCRVLGPVEDETLQSLRDGVQLEDGPAHFSDIKRGESRGVNEWFYVVLLEGRNREVRRLWEAVGHQVSRLKRVRYGPVFMPNGLRSGQYEELSARDVRTLREDIGLSAGETGLTLESEKAGRSARGESQARTRQSERPARPAPKKRRR